MINLQEATHRKAGHFWDGSDHWTNGVCNSRPSGRTSARKPRIFLYSHDTYGLGHLRRNLAIAEHLLRRRRGYSVRLITGSPLTGTWSFPTNLDVTALPPVVKIGAEKYRPRNSTLPLSLVKAQREAQILKVVIEEKPDVLLVDHAPAGMNAELLSTLTFIRREIPETNVLLGLRDILDEPVAVRDIWESQGIMPIMDSLYDRILVYGCRSLFDVVEAYRIPDRIAAKLSYCGYIARQPKKLAAASSARPFVVVTAGGGEDGYFLMEAYLNALAILPENCVRSMIIAGPLMSESQRASLEALAGSDPNVAIMTSTTDLPAMLEEADLVIAMGGYNTSVEIIASGKPAILVPRAAPRAEQRMRATMLAKLGYVWAVEQGPALDCRLAERIRAVLAGERPQPIDGAIDLDGASRVGDHCEEIVGRASRQPELVI
jgi:predicted glycosyltransferase